MENSCNDELLCSLKDELREVTAQINGKRLRDSI